MVELNGRSMSRGLLLATLFIFLGCTPKVQTSESTQASTANPSPTPTPTPTATPTPTPTVTAVPAAVMGYANEGGMATTGGEGGATVTVTTTAQLRTAVSDSTPRIIEISGVLNGNNDNVYVGSNKTIIGLKNAELRAYGLYLSGSNNVIIQNLKMYDGNGGYSPLAIKDSSHHVWIDHCEFIPSDNPDNGHVFASVTRDAQYVTVSWTKFTGKYTGFLIGASETDPGPFYVTFHHNLFEGMLERQPKVSHGRVHVFNNYYKNAMTNGHTPVGITSVNESIVRTDNNYFQNFQGAAISTEYNYPSESYGQISGLNTNYKDTPGAFHITTAASTWLPPYTYNTYLTPVMDVPTLVIQNAGANLK